MLILLVSSFIILDLSSSKQGLETSRRISEAEKS